MSNKRYSARSLSCLALLVVAACETPTHPEPLVLPTGHATLSTQSMAEINQGILYLYNAGTQYHQYGLLDAVQLYAFQDPLVRAYQHVNASRLAEARQALDQFIQVVQGLSSAGELPQQVCTSLIDLALKLKVTATPVVVPLFSDNFESGAFDRTAGGFRWTNQQNASVEAGIGRSGRGARFRYGPDAQGADSWSELRFVMPPLREVWFEYWVYIPSNYEHRSQTPDNNKWWMITDSDKDWHVRALLESWRGNLDRARPMHGPLNEPGDHYSASSEWGMATPDGFIAAGDRGRWVQLRFHVRVSDAGQTNGVWRMWKNGLRMVNETQVPNASLDGTTRYFREGYLMGWSNSGFTQRTDIVLDDFKLYGSNPGW
jgi:hypothetical protein